MAQMSLIVIDRTDSTGVLLLATGRIVAADTWGLAVESKCLGAAPRCIDDRVERRKVRLIKGLSIVARAGGRPGWPLIVKYSGVSVHAHHYRSLL